MMKASHKKIKIDRTMQWQVDFDGANDVTIVPRQRQREVRRRYDENGVHHTRDAWLVTFTCHGEDGVYVDNTPYLGNPERRYGELWTRERRHEWFDAAESRVYAQNDNGLSLYLSACSVFYPEGGRPRPRYADRFKEYNAYPSPLSYWPSGPDLKTTALQLEVRRSFRKARYVKADGKPYADEFPKLFNPTQWRVVSYQGVQPWTWRTIGIFNATTNKDWIIRASPDQVEILYNRFQALYPGGELPIEAYWFDVVEIQETLLRDELPIPWMQLLGEERNTGRNRELINLFERQSWEIVRAAEAERCTPAMVRLEVLDQTDNLQQAMRTELDALQAAGVVAPVDTGANTTVMPRQVLRRRGG